MSRATCGLAVFAVGLLVSTTAAALSVDEVPNPQKRSGEWVADEAEVLDDGTEQEVNRRLDALERDTGVEVAVVTVQQVDAPTPKDFATDLFNRWGIGKQESDNGLLVLLVMGEQRLEMETGYGMEAVLTDGWLKRMQQEEMIPHFKSGDFEEGLVAGIEASESRIRANSEAIGEGASAAPPPAQGGGGSGFPWFWVMFFFGTAGLGGWLLWYRSVKKYTCPECDSDLRILPETEDDEYLDPGEETEEAIGSVDYHVYNCEACDYDRVERDAAWFSWFERCPDCGNKTLGTDTETVEPATTSSSGTKRVTKECSHCDYSDTFTRTIPEKSSSSTSTGSSSFGGGGGGFSGGGGGGFGGGSSGGGGAGSSW